MVSRTSPYSPPFTIYLITRSALANTFGGIVRPICWAAFRLDELEFIWLFYGKIAWLCTVKNLMHKQRGAAKHLGIIRRIRHEATGIH